MRRWRVPTVRKRFGLIFFWKLFLSPATAVLLTTPRSLLVPQERPLVGATLARWSVRAEQPENSVRILHSSPQNRSCLLEIPWFLPREPSLNLRLPRCPLRFP